MDGAGTSRSTTTRCPNRASLSRSARLGYKNPTTWYRWSQYRVNRNQANSLGRDKAEEVSEVCCELTRATWTIESGSHSLSVKRTNSSLIPRNMLQRGKENTQCRNVLCCKATTLGTSSIAPMWGGDGDAVGERPSLATSLMSVVSTCVRNRCMVGRPD